MELRKERRQISLIRSVVFNNLMRDYMPLPIDRLACSTWTKTLPRSGPTVLYTSYVYQLASVFKSYARLLERFSGVRFASRLSSLGGLMVRPKRDELARASVILNHIVDLLRKLGMEVGYLYEEEPYSGALLLELGLLDEFRAYGKKMLEFLRAHGIYRLVTVDPHTFNALLRLKTMLNSDLDVANYLQLIHPSSGEGRFVMHDSCLYSKYMDMGGQIRKLARDAGVNLLENRMVTAQDTSSCCGAPIESVNIELSERIARARAAKLLTVCDSVLVACPLCYQNLLPYTKSIRDIAEVLS